MPTLEDAFANELAGLGQDRTQDFTGFAAGAGGAWWSVFEKKSGALGAAIGAFTQIKAGGAPTHGGSLPFKAPVSPRKLIICRAWARCGTILVPTIKLFDYLGYVNFTTTINTLQNVSGFSLPRWTNGEGLVFFVLVKTAPGAATPTISLRYTNTLGVTNRLAQATLLNAPAQGQIGHDGEIIELQSGDTGFTGFASIQLSASWLGGTASVIVARPCNDMPVDAVDKTAGPFEYLGNGAPYLLDSQECFLVGHYKPNVAGTPKVTYGVHVNEL